MNRAYSGDGMQNALNPVDPPGCFRKKKYLWKDLQAKVSELHQKAAAGDKTAVQEAFSLLEDIRGRFPANNLMDAYYGSILTLQGRDAIEPIERLEKVRLGLKFLDNAVEQEPDNIDIRIIRGYVCYHLPEVFFHRTAIAVEDFKYLLAGFEKDRSIFSDEFFQQILKDLISAYKRLGLDQESQIIHEKELEEEKEGEDHR